MLNKRRIFTSPFAGEHPLEHIVTFFHFKRVLMLGLCATFTKTFKKIIYYKLRSFNGSALLQSNKSTISVKNNNHLLSHKRKRHVTDSIE